MKNLNYYQNRFTMAHSNCFRSGNIEPNTMAYTLWFKLMKNEDKHYMFPSSKVKEYLDIMRDKRYVEDDLYDEVLCLLNEDVSEGSRDVEELSD